MTRITRVILEVKEVKINRRMRKFGRQQLRIRVNTLAMDKGYFIYDKTFDIEGKKVEFRQEALRVAQYYQVPFKDLT